MGQPWIVLRKADANFLMADMLTLKSGKTVRSDAPAKQERGRGGRGAVPAPVQSIGPLLRERREAMGVTLAEAEVATRIRQKYLAALGTDEWDLLPGEVVGRGFLRNYSTYSGLEPTEMIERRRAVADDSLAAVFVNTSAGSALPPNARSITGQKMWRSKTRATIWTCHARSTGRPCWLYWHLPFLPGSPSWQFPCWGHR